VRIASTGSATLIGKDHAALESSTILSGLVDVEDLLGRACDSGWARTLAQCQCCSTTVRFGLSRILRKLVGYRQEGRGSLSTAWRGQGGEGDGEGGRERAR